MVSIVFTEERTQEKKVGLTVSWGRRGMVGEVGNQEKMSLIRTIEIEVSEFSMVR